MTIDTKKNATDVSTLERLVAINSMFAFFDMLHTKHGDCQFEKVKYYKHMFELGYNYGLVEDVFSNMDCFTAGKQYRVLSYVNNSDDTMIILTSTFDYPVLD